MRMRRTAATDVDVDWNATAPAVISIPEFIGKYYARVLAAERPVAFIFFGREKNPRWACTLQKGTARWAAACDMRPNGKLKQAIECVLRNRKTI